MVFELICHHGGPRYLLKVVPVAGIKAEQLKELLMEVYFLVKEKRGCPISLICDNCPLNQKVYKLIGGPGKVKLEPNGENVFVGYDYTHVHKNIRNNWITEPTIELTFKVDSVEYTAFWKDVIAVYEEDQKSTFRLTKLTYSSVYPKPLQRQNVALVCQVFNDKTVAAMISLQTKLHISEGTINWITLITQWFKMMSVKSKYLGSRFNDEYREAWTNHCNSFTRLLEISTIVSTCIFNGVRGRQQKLTKYTGNAFLVTTENNVLASKMLLEIHNFQYILSAIFSQDALEKFFGQSRHRCSGNFCIDIGDVLAAAKVQHLHQLLKYEIIPEGEVCVADCSLCDSVADSSDLELIDETSVKDTEALLESNDTLKHSHKKRNSLAT